MIAVIIGDEEPPMKGDPITDLLEPELISP